MAPNFRREMRVGVSFIWPLCRTLQFAGGCCERLLISLVPDPTNEEPSRALKEECGTLCRPNRLTEVEANICQNLGIANASTHTFRLCLQVKPMWMREPCLTCLYLAAPSIAEDKYSPAPILR